MLAASFRGNFPYQISGLLVVIQQPDCKVKTSHVHIVHNLPIPLFYNVVNRKQKRSCVRWCEEIGRFEVTLVKDHLDDVRRFVNWPCTAGNKPLIHEFLRPFIHLWTVPFASQACRTLFPSPGGCKDMSLGLSCVYVMFIWHAVSSYVIACRLSFIPRTSTISSISLPKDIIK